MRSSVDFPQPDGPRMVMKSFSRDLRFVGSSARTGAPPRTPGKTRETFSIWRIVRGHASLHGKSVRLTALNSEVGDRGR